MSGHIRPRSIAAAVVVLLALAACVPASDEPDPAPTVTQVVTETAEPDAAAADPGADPSVAPDGEADEPEDSAAPPAAPPADPPPAAPSATPPAATPAVAVLSQQCTSGKLKVTLTASYDNTYRKGINSVVFERENNENAWVSSNGSWLGPETGQGNQWTGNPPGHKTQGYQDELRITVTASGGATTVLLVAITANC